MSHVKFLETRRYRAPGGSVTLKYERGKTYPFQPYMREYLNLGHAVLVEGVDATPAPATVMPPAAMERTPARKAKAVDAATAPAVAKPMERSAPVPLTTPRDPVKNGGLSEA